MNKEEALLQWRDLFYRPLLEQALDRVEQNFNANQQQLITDMQGRFQEFYQQIAEMQAHEDKQPIMYIHLSLLRTSILQQSYLYLMEAYSDEWYEDEVECRSVYPAAWIYEYYSTFVEELKLSCKRYMGVLTPVDAEQAGIEAIPHFHQYAVSLLRLAVPEMVQTTSYKQIVKAERLMIRCGDYKDISESVYIEDHPLPSAAELRRHLEREAEFFYENASHSVLNKLQVSEKDWRYTDFSHSQLAGSELSACLLFGTRWQYADLTGAQFYGSVITDADFRYGNLRGADFKGASAQPFHDNGYRLPGINGLHFDYANLDEADLTGIYFLEKACFTGASMEGTRLSALHRDRFEFSREQEAGIIWIEEEIDNESAIILLNPK